MSKARQIGEDAQHLSPSVKRYMKRVHVRNMRRVSVYDVVVNTSYAGYEF